MRRGMDKLTAADKDTGVITRAVKQNNGRGQMVPTGEKASRTIKCRVSYQSGGVWPGKSSEMGLTIDTSPYVLAAHDADIEKDDVLEWRGKRYTVGIVSRPSLGGGAVCTQAPLVEVRQEAEYGNPGQGF
jgi:hypothetical protein